MSLVRYGKVYDLQVTLEPGIPVWIGHPPFFTAYYMRHEESWPVFKPATVANEIIMMAGHVSTHIDSLGHIGEWEGDHVNLYGGINAREAEDYKGLTKLGIETMPPVIARGILLDVAGYKNVDVLPDSYAITAEDLQKTAESEGIELLPGDVVLIRTGFMKYWKVDNDRCGRAAGPDVAAAEYLVNKGMVLTGSDTQSYEQMPVPQHPVHRYLMVHKGITIMENLWLEELAGDKVYEFLFIALPLKIQGATGSEIRPIAIR